MVSTELYLDIFSNVMPQRVVTIAKLFISKVKYDSKLKTCIKNKKSAEETISTLQNLIGKDTFFRRPEKKKGSQTLRHHVWKTHNSFNFLAKYLQEYLNKTDDKIVRELESNIFLGHNVGKVVEIARKASDLTSTIDELLVRESRCLRFLSDKAKSAGSNGQMLTEDDMMEYSNIVSSEMDALKSLGNLAASFGEVLAGFEKSLNNYLKSYTKSSYYKTRPTDVPKVIHEIVNMCAIIGYALAIYIAYENRSGQGNGLEKLLSGFADTEIARYIAVISTTVAVVNRVVLSLIPHHDSKVMAKIFSEVLD